MSGEGWIASPCSIAWESRQGKGKAEVRMLRVAMLKAKAKEAAQEVDAGVREPKQATRQATRVEAKGKEQREACQRSRRAHGERTH